MSRIGLPICMALDIVMEELNKLGIRDKIKIIASEKILTPDDALELASVLFLQLWENEMLRS